MITVLAEGVILVIEAYANLKISPDLRNPLAEIEHMCYNIKERSLRRSIASVLLRAMQERSLRPWADDSCPSRHRECSLRAMKNAPYER